jgi:tetratricopeptide (TPR) repeat protein
MKRRRPSRALPFAFVSLVLAACSKEPEPAPPDRGEPPAAEPQADRIAREMAAAHFAHDDREKARAALAPLIERERPDPRDLIWAAMTELSLGAPERAKALLDRAEPMLPEDPALHYNLARVHRMQASYPEAVPHLRAALAGSPDDVPARLMLADTLGETGGDPSEIEKLYRDVRALGVDQLGAWYALATYRLAFFLRRDASRSEEVAALLEEFSVLGDRGIKPPASGEVDNGTLGRIPFQAPRGNRPSGTGRALALAPPQAILPEFRGSIFIEADDVDDDGRLDLYAWGTNGLAVGLQRDGFAWEARKIAGGEVNRALAFDLGNDDDVDFVLGRRGELAIVEDVRATPEMPPDWQPWKKELPRLREPEPNVAAAPLDIAAVDFDHDGDLDLLAVGAFGTLLLRDDGAASPSPEGRFTDVTEAAGFSPARAFAWCAVEDFDTDQDVDLLLGDAGGYFLASNQRGGKFADESAWLADVPPSECEPVIADFDADGRPDLWVPVEGGALCAGQPSGRFAVKGSSGATLGGSLKLQAVDLDLDGALDVVAIDLAADSVTGTNVRASLAVGLPDAKQLTIPCAVEPFLIDDLDGDLRWDVVAFTANGVEVQKGSLEGANALRLAFRGKKDNRRGVGAVVEVRAGGVYRRIFWLGEPVLLGVGAATETDYVRVTWPNGVVQYFLRRDLGDRATLANELDLLQTEGLVGSCPFLYAWNGSRFEFVSDVLGITPLGLPIAPGVYVPPDHDEYVLVRGDQLAARGDFFELQLTEELREVTYLDRTRLDVVDSPEGTEIYPNELFRFPPFPEARVHTVREALAPVRATGSDGKDWTVALARADDEYAAPFDPAPPQFLGLATPHWLELAFDPAAVARAPKLRLVMTGWFYWTDASVNVAAAFDPEHEFVPPILSVPDGNGGWRPTGPPIGFPAGKTKTMVIDVSALIAREDPRIRLDSTLRLYWDSIRLALDAGDAPIETRSIEPESAELWRRGFSAPQRPEQPNQPERFDWDRLAEEPRWNQHPGLYTKYGESLELVTAIDDRFVVMGSGDALRLRFDARSLPPPRAGFRRDYLLFLDGWAKDRDPNTTWAEHVEPMPFHTMSAFPYRADERFPDTPEIRAWREEWLVRPAHAWIEPVAPNAR